MKQHRRLSPFTVTAGACLFSVALLSASSGEIFAQSPDIVRSPSGDIVSGNPRGDIFESDRGALLAPDTTPAPEFDASKSEANEKPSEEPGTEDQGDVERDPENMENLKEQVMQRAAQEGGLRALIKQAQTIKKDVGVDSDEAGTKVDRRMLENRLKGLQRAIDEGDRSSDDSNRF